MVGDRKCPIRPFSSLTTSSAAGRVGTGRNGFTTIAAGPDEAIYAIQPDGTLLWYCHDGADQEYPIWAGLSASRRDGSPTRPSRPREAATSTAGTQRASSGATMGFAPVPSHGRRERRSGWDGSGGVRHLTAAEQPRWLLAGGAPGAAPHGAVVRKQVWAMALAAVRRQPARRG